MSCNADCVVGVRIPGNRCERVRDSGVGGGEPIPDSGEAGRLSLSSSMAIVGVEAVVSLVLIGDIGACVSVVFRLGVTGEGEFARAPPI